MKKTLTVLLVLAVAMSGLFAVTSVLKLTTDVEDAYQMAFYTANDFATAIGTTEQEIGTTEAFAYLKVTSNSPTGYNLKIEGTKLTNQTTNSSSPKYTYAVSVAGQANGTAVTAGVVPETFTGYTAGSDALTFAEDPGTYVLSTVGFKVGYKIMDDNWAKAAVGTYKADITVTYTAKS